MHRCKTLFAYTLFAIAITGLGVFYGSVMDGSLFPPSGGGWRCYVDCVAAAWGLVLLLALTASVPFGTAAFARWLTGKISG
jgi:hypothetical protein